MADIMNFKCPSCGAPLMYKGGTGNMTCEYCEAQFTIEQVRAAEEAEAAAPESSDMTWTQAQPEMFTDEDGKMQGFSCPSCGAQIMADEKTGATECPYCGNQAIVPSAFEGIYKPDCMIPFKVDKAAAEKALAGFYEGKKLLPDNFTKGNRVSKIQGVYVPFWLMSCRARGEMSFLGQKVKRWNDAEADYVKRDHYNLIRKGEMDFKRIPVDASNDMDDSTMDSIEPFRYEELVPYEKAYFSGYLANRFDVSAEEAQPRAGERVRNSVEKAMKDTLRGYESIEVKNHHIVTKDDKTEYAMLPVWMLSTKYQDEVYTFAMNGQTGKLVGALPVDQGKYRKYLGICAAAVFALAQILIFFIAKKPTAAAEIIALLIALLIGWFYASSLKAGMNTISSKTQASGYMDSGSFRLDTSKDLFLYTKTERNLKSGGKKEGPPAGGKAKPAAGAKPGPAAKPAGGAKPAPAARPGGGAKPGPAVKSGTGTRPGSAASPKVPAAGAKPGPAARPAGGAKPGPAARPAAGAKPGPAARPAAGAKPGPAARPAAGAKPGPAARPAAGAKPGSGSRPGSGTKGSGR